MATTWCFAGWGQNPASLQVIAPENSTSIPYITSNNYEDFIETIDSYKTKPDIVIGWSLGGQVALRLISDAIIQPKALILIATPFQFIQGHQLNCGMLQNEFEEFYHRFVANEEQTLKRFNLLVARNDKNEKTVRGLLQPLELPHPPLGNWLKELAEFTCQHIDFTSIPSTLLIHGQDDILVDASQTALFKPFISDCKIEIFSQCGHAPHLHNTKQTKILIETCYEHTLQTHR